MVDVVTSEVWWARMSASDDGNADGGIGGDEGKGERDLRFGRNESASEGNAEGIADTASEAPGGTVASSNCELFTKSEYTGSEDGNTPAAKSYTLLRATGVGEDGGMSESPVCPARAGLGPRGTGVRSGETTRRGVCADLGERGGLWGRAAVGGDSGTATGVGEECRVGGPGVGVGRGGGGAPVIRRRARATPGSAMIAPTADAGDVELIETPRSWASNDAQGTSSCFEMNDNGWRPRSSLPVSAHLTVPTHVI
jgi:hypothetical protein